MGTWGTGPFDSDGALDFIGDLADRPGGKRREVLEQLFSRVRDQPELLGSQFFPDEVVAASAVVAASLPGGEQIRHELADHGYGTVLSGPADPGLSAAACEALLVAAGRGGPWHAGWTDPELARQARRTTDELAAIFFREQHSQDQELPLEF